MVHKVRMRRLMTSQDLSDMKTSTKKTWSTRTVRWLALLPPTMLGMDQKKLATKKMLKRWVTENIPTIGDRILWGKPGEGGRREAGDPPGPPNPPDKGDRGGRKRQAKERRESQKAADERQKRGLEGWLLGVGQARGEQQDQKLEVGLAACPTSSLAAVVSTSQKGSWGRYTASGGTYSGSSKIFKMVTLLLLRMMLGRAEDWLKGASQTGGSQKGSRGRCSAAGRTSSADQSSCESPSCGEVIKSGGLSKWNKEINSGWEPVKTGVG